MKNKKIIIVDTDELDICLYKTICKYSLEDDKIDFEIYSNAEYALERVTKNGFDLLITSLNLNNKKIDGLKLARMTWGLGKHTIIITSHKKSCWLWLNLFYRDMRKWVKIINKPTNPLNLIKSIQDRINKTSSTTKMFDIITKSFIKIKKED